MKEKIRTFLIILITYPVGQYLLFDNHYIGENILFGAVLGIIMAAMDKYQKRLMNKMTPWALSKIIKPKP